MTVISNLSLLNQYGDYLLPRYSNFPRGRYVSLLIIRKTESETIFRTEGSGEGLVKETVIAGERKENAKPMRRVVISKRKQTAVERRTGRELLREHDLLKMVTGKNNEQPCSLNMNAPCGKCIDCMLYGYAVGGGGAQKSRVMTDDSYSLGPVAQVTGRRTFNATFDNGAISSRLGRVRNTLSAIIFSDTEVFSNLELTQAVYDILLGDKDELDFPLSDTEVQQAVDAAANALLDRLVSRTPVVVRGESLANILRETIALYRDTESVK